MPTEVLRYAAFTTGGRGGNPAGVVLDADGLDEQAMQEIAADLGYSETAFLVAREHEPNVYDVRYFAAELVFHTPAGLVTVSTERTDEGLVAELTSVSPRVSPAAPALVDAVLAALGWRREDLDP